MRTRTLTLAAVVLVAGGVVTFALARRSPAFTEPPRDVPHVEGTTLRFSPAFAERAKLAYALPERAALTPVVDVTGTVTFDPERVAAVGARIAGRARTIAKYPGDAVKAGDTLCEIESAELGQAQASVLSARAHASAAAANDTRESALAEARVSSQRDAELARATSEAARAELRAAEQRQRALGGDATREAGVLLVKSPIDGKVVASHVSRGQSVEPSFTLFRVADLERVWVELAVFEREIGRVREGDDVEISPQTNQALALRGTVAHVGEVIDLETRSSDVRVVVPNRDRSLRPGQSVLARILTRTPRPAALLLPHVAVTSVDGKPTVFVARGDGAVEPRAVTIGARDGTRVEITNGLADGERVVTSGVFALKSELFR